MGSIHVVGQGASDMDGNGQMIFSFGRFGWLVGWSVGWLAGVLNVACGCCCERACVWSELGQPSQKIERVPKCKGVYGMA